MGSKVFCYARVSTDEQNADMQVDALKTAGVPSENVFIDHYTGKTMQRPQWKRLYDQLREGDKLVIWKLDRLGRSTVDLLMILDHLQKNNVGFRSLTEGFDTTTSQGKLFASVFAAFAEYERNIIVERTKEGLASAKKRGSVFGRPKKVDIALIRQALALNETPDMPTAKILKKLGVSRATYYRALAEGRKLHIEISVDGTA